MKLIWIGWSVGTLSTYHLLSCFLVFGVKDVDTSRFKAEVRTKQLLFNIRSHLAKQVDEVVHEKECESGLILCDPPKEKVESEEDSDEIPPPPKTRGSHKPEIKVNPKDVIQSMIHKVHIKRTADKRAVEPIDEENDDDDDDDEEKEVEGEDEDSNESREDNKKKGEPKLKAEGVEGKDKAKKGITDKLKDKKENAEEKPKGAKQVEDKSKGVTKTKAGKDDKKTKKTKSKKSAEDDEDGAHFPKDLPVFSLAGNVVESELCRKHSRLYLRQLSRYKMWALLMYDATAKFPSGVLQGNINQFGDFDECLTVNAVVKNKQQRTDDNGVQGRYCLAAIDVEATADEGALQQAVYKALAYGFMQSEAEDAGYFIPRFTTINWGLCVPASCPPEDVERALIDELSDFNETAGVLFKVQVDEEACFDREDAEFSVGLGTILTAFFYLTIIFITGLATYRDLKANSKAEAEVEIKENEEVEENTEEKMEEHNENGDEPIENAAENAEGNENTDSKESDNEVDAEEKQRQGKLQRLLMAFSLKRTTEELLKPGTDEDISCIHGIKALFTIMLYIGHRTGPISLTPFTNRIEFTKTTNEPYSTLFRASLIYTDGFLLASGVLTSFNMAKEIKENGRIAWLRRFLSRVIRLTPSLLAVVLFYGYIAEELGSGPLWGPLVGKNAELCRENLWKNLLFVQNFFDFEEMCAPQTHQLALDFQLSLAAPLLVYILYNYDIVGLLILQSLYLLSSSLRYLTTYNNELSLVFFHGISVSQLYRTANLLYTQAIYRATPYVLGVTVGYYLRKQGDDFRDRLQKPLIAIGWIVATCLGFLAVVTPIHLADRGYEYNALEAAQYAALAPISWSIALGWLIGACHLGYGGRLNDFLSSRPLVVFSRLSYSVYLIQFLVFNHYVGTIRAAKVFSIAEVLNPFEIVMILAFSVIVTLLFDIPMKDVKSIILDRSPAAVAEEEGEKGTEGDEGEETTADTKEDEENLIDEDQREDPENLPLELDEENALEEDVLEDLDGDIIPNEEDEEEDMDHILRRSSRIRFDDEDDEKEFWVEDDLQPPQAEGEDIENFWGEDED